MKKIRILSLCVSASLLISFNFCNPSFSDTEKTYSFRVSKTQEWVDNLIDRGKYADAQKIAEEMLKKDPNNIKAKVTLGNIYSKQYKIEAAFKEFQSIIARDPRNAEAHNGLGMVYYRKTTSSNMDIIKNTEKYNDLALNEFQTAIRLNPEYYRAYNNAGKIFQQTGRLNTAEQYYRKALDIEPNYSDAVENLGTVLFAKNQIDAAIDKYKQAIELNSKKSSAYYHLGEAYVAKGDYGKAINHLQTSLYLFPNSAPVHDMLGKAYEMQGNEAAALSEYKKASLIKPEFTRPYISIANIYQDRGDSEMAIAELRNAVSVNPDFLEGKLKIADASVDLGKNDQAIKYYKDIMNDKNYSQAALKGLARAYFNKAQEVNSYAEYTSESEYVDAENALRQAIEYNPNDIQLYLALLRISRLTNNDDVSEAYLSKIIRNPVNKPIDHIIKGEAYLTYNRYKDAHNEFEGALNGVNNTGDTLHLGEIFIINRQYQSAKEAFNKVLTKDPNNQKAIKALERIKKNEDQAIAKLNIARGFDKAHQKVAAIEAYRDCLSLNPGLSEAQLRVAKAYEKAGYLSDALDHYTAYINLIPTYDRDYTKYHKKVIQLNQKLQAMQTKGQPVKKFTRT